MSIIKPRYYQTEAFNKIKDSFKRGNKHICVALSGGAGKSLLCKMIIDSALNKNSKIGFFSFRKSLTEQIKTYFENIDNVTIGTLQTYGKTETDLFDLVIFDEKDYHDTKLKNNIKSKYSITLSGFPTDSYGNILDYDEIVEGIQFAELIKAGFAKEVKIFSTPLVDTSSLKKQGGDFSVSQSFELMTKSKVQKDIIEVYKRYCIGRKTLLFAVDTNHSEILKKEFIEAGIKCETVHSKKKNNEQILKDFENDKFDLLINVVMISIGVDLPFVNTILFARPMASVPLMMQSIWRGTRKFKDDYCLVLDCAEVLKRCNFHPLDKLDFNKKKQDKNKMCKCGLKFKLINRQTKPLNDTEYVVISDYKCDCGNTETVENIKIINISICDGCGEIFESVGGLQIENNKDSINFDLECKCCGHKRKFREILLTNDELKEVEYSNAFKSDKWESVKVILKAECKKCNYKWQYSERLFDRLQNTCSNPTEAIDKIKFIMKSGKKISQLMYM